MGWWGRLLFSWVSPLLSKGSQCELIHDDLPPLAAEDAPSVCSDLLWRHWAKPPEGKRSLLRALVMSFGRTYFFLGLLKFFNDALNFVGPLLLNLLVDYLSSPSPSTQHEGQAKGCWATGPNCLPIGLQPSDNHVSSWRASHVAVIVYHWWGALVASWSRDGPYFGYWCAAMLGMVAVLKALLNSYYSYHLSLVGCRVRSALMCSLYKKALLARSNDGAKAPGTETAPGTANDSKANGSAPVDLQTLMAVDTGRVVNTCGCFHELWSLPLQILVALYMLYVQVRFAFLAGLAVCLLVIPANQWIMKKIRAANMKMMRHKDERMRVLSEMIGNMRAVKMAALEEVMRSKVLAARGPELEGLATEKYLDALCVYFWAATSLLFTVLTFVVVVVSGGELTAAVVFTSVALFNVLIYPLNNFPWVLNGIVEAWISLDRIQQFLSKRELRSQWCRVPEGSEGAEDRRLGPGRGDKPRPQRDICTLKQPHGKTDTPCSWSWPSRSCQFTNDGTVDAPPPPGMCVDQHGSGKPDDIVMEMCHVDMRWQEAYPLCLSQLSFSLPRGRLVVIRGPVGAGKSSLLTGLLGEMDVASGQILRSSELTDQTPIGYVGSSPWVISGTIRSNIIMEREMDRPLYDQVLHATALQQDLQHFLHGDLTQVSSQGTTLSGGQAVRIALARALYHQCSLYVMDDVLAAVDNHVAHWLVDHALTGELMKGRTCVIATKSRLLLPHASLVVHLDQGHVVYMGSPEEYMTSGLVGPLGPRRKKLWMQQAEAQAVVDPSEEMVDNDLGEGTSSGASSPVATETGTREVSPFSTEVQSGLDSDQGASGPAEENSLLTSMDPQGAPPQENEKIEGTIEDDSGGAEIKENHEEREVGHVKGHVYLAYMNAVGWWWVFLVLFSLLAMQASKVGNDLWLSYWVTREAHHQGNSSALASGWTPGLKWAPAALSYGGLLSTEGHLHGGYLGDRGALAWVPTGGHVLLEEGLWNSQLNSSQWQRASDAEGAEWSSWGDSRTLLPSCVPVRWRGAPSASGTHRHRLSRIHCEHGGSQRALCTGGSEEDKSIFVKVLFAITVINAICTLARAFSFAYAGLCSARFLHERLFQVVVQAPLVFFDTTPPGQVLNRFSSDTSVIDGSLPFIMNIFLANAVSLLAVVSVMCYSQPFMGVMVLPLAWMYRRIQVYYRSTSRQLRRLDALSLSPVYSLFSEALHGAISIRAYAIQQYMYRRCELLVTINQTVAVTGAATGNWLSCRLQLLAAMMITGVALLAALAHQRLLPGSHHSSSAGLVGLSLAYALPVVNLLNGLLTSSAETEQEMVAVERVMQYVRGVPAEEGARSRDYEAVDCEAGLSSQAGDLHLPVVEFQDVFLKYRPELSYSLGGVSFTLDRGEKLGVCGRTGAGKSSLLAVLLRLVERSSGMVRLQGSDIAHWPLHKLRKSFGVVPQTPLLFKASVRENLDLDGSCADDDLLEVLRSVHLEKALWRCLEHFRGDPHIQADRQEGMPAEQQWLLHEHLSERDPRALLDLQLGEGGIQLSTGQGQLLCLGRMLLLKRRIILLDECTASVDLHTSHLISEVLDEQLEEESVMQVAHSLDAILHYDKVAVMAGGKIIELGSPALLQEQEGSHFQELLKARHHT